MPKFKNQSILQRIFLGKHDRSLGFADIDIPMLFISTFLLYLFVEQDPPQGEVIIEVNIDAQSTN